MCVRVCVCVYVYICMCVHIKRVYMYFLIQTVILYISVLTHTYLINCERTFALLILPGEQLVFRSRLQPLLIPI